MADDPTTTKHHDEWTQEEWLEALGYNQDDLAELYPNGEAHSDGSGAYYFYASSNQPNADAQQKQKKADEFNLSVCEQASTLLDTLIKSKTLEILSSQDTSFPYMNGGIRYSNVIPIESKNHFLKNRNMGMRLFMSFDVSLPALKELHYCLRCMQNQYSPVRDCSHRSRVDFVKKYQPFSNNAYNKVITICVGFLQGLEVVSTKKGMTNEEISALIVDIEKCIDAMQKMQELKKEYEQIHGQGTFDAKKLAKLAKKPKNKDENLK